MLLNLLLGLAAGAVVTTILIAVKIYVKHTLRKNEKVVIFKNPGKETPEIVKTKHEGKIKENADLTYQDVLDYIELMRGQPARFPTVPVVKEKINEKMPYYLLCGERLFGLIIAKDNIVTNLILRINPKKVGQYNKRYKLQNMPFPSSDNWYRLTINNPCENKLEIYKMLEECYDYTLRRYYFENDQYDCNLAKAEYIAIEREIAKKVGLKEKSNENIEKEYHAALENFKSDYLLQVQKNKKYVKSKGNSDYISEKEYQTALEIFKQNYLLSFNSYK